MAFGIFTMLCNHHLCLVSKHFYYLKIKSMPIKQLLPISPSAQTTTSLLSVFMLLLILDGSYKWNHNTMQLLVSGFFHLA